MCRQPYRFVDANTIAMFALWHRGGRSLNGFSCDSRLETSLNCLNKGFEIGFWRGAQGEVDEAQDTTNYTTTAGRNPPFPNRKAIPDAVIHRHRTVHRISPAEDQKPEPSETDTKWGPRKFETFFFSNGDEAIGSINRNLLFQFINFFCWELFFLLMTIRLT